MAADLPIAEVLDQLSQALEAHPCVVLRAPPGAGKTTCVPLYLLNAGGFEHGKIVMLAPRRLAARAAAHRMAQMLSEKVGQTVGYRVRMDTQISAATRIEVVTEGVLIRMLQDDPALTEVKLVIFDEFHERSLNADLGLALCLDLQGVLNVDIRLLVMSATMATQPVAAMLGDAPVIEAKGRSFPIRTHYVGRHTPANDMAEVTRTVLLAAEQEAGSILVFLPGAAEIQQVAQQLARSSLGAHWQVMPLLGALTPAEQDRAIMPAPEGYRKIVLATAIAETSLTIEGIRVVVDSGLQRISRFDLRSGMARLVTLPVNRASADQRRGRAGRLGPGLCYRLWSQAIQGTLSEDRQPEVLAADLCGLALELARWGIHQPGELRWLNPPPEAAYAAACELLHSLNALNRDHKITRHGKAVAALPVHPRLAHMLVMARPLGQIRAACDLAALLTERDPLRFETGHYDVDLQLRFDLLQHQRNGRPFSHPMARMNGNACKRILKLADQLYRQADGPRGPKATSAPEIGQLLAWAYPDRIARRRPGDRSRCVMTNGQGVRLDANVPMATEEFIVAVEADGQRRDGRIYRAAAYSLAQLKAQYGDRLKWQQDVYWDEARQSVQSRHLLKLDALTVQTRPLKATDEAQRIAAMMDGITRHSLDVLPWNKMLRNWQARVCFLHRQLAEEEKWPDVGDPALLADMPRWLGPYLTGITRLRELNRIDLQAALFSHLAYDQHRQLDILAPSHWTVPSGSRIPIDYTGKVPVLAVRLQEMFGLEQTPAVANGRQPLLIHLLSPASRPVQVTQDLAGFWKNSYHEVKKELKGRYPKHHWPDDPLTAQPTARAKPRK